MKKIIHTLFITLFLISPVYGQDIATLFQKIDQSVKYYPDSKRLVEVTGQLSPAEYYQFGKVVGICTHYPAPSKNKGLQYQFETAMKEVSNLLQVQMTPMETRKFCEKVRQYDVYIKKILSQKPQ